jgi:hypothetical protein
MAEICARNDWAPHLEAATKEEKLLARIRRATRSGEAHGQRGVREGTGVPFGWQRCCVVWSSVDFMDGAHPLSEKQVTSCKDVFEIARDRGAGVVLYRGQDIDAALSPKIARLARELKWDYPNLYEDQILAMFRRVGAPHLSLGLFESEFRFLSVARHYGLPTRLLDWTENPFVALWFAVEKREGPDDKGNSYLYVYRVGDNDIEYHPDSQSKSHIDDARKVKVFQPSHIDPRIAAQSAWFSVHPYNREGKHYVSLIGRDVEGSVTRHWINAQSVLGIREESPERWNLAGDTVP